MPDGFRLKDVFTADVDPPPAQPDAQPATPPIKTCGCGDPLKPGVVHRYDGPCYVDEPEVSQR